MSTTRQTLKLNRYMRQQGAVLIIALLVLSLMVAIAARFTSDFQVTIARSQQSLVSTQLQQLLFSAENFARWGLVEDAKVDNDNQRYKKNNAYGNYDHLGEGWAQPVDLPADEANISAVLEDALGRFNLNQLQGQAKADAGNPAGTFGARFTIGQQRFIRLLQTEPNNLIDLSLAEQITEAVIDWIDSDDTPTGSGGAESAYYQSLEKPYRSANQPFVSATELRLVKGVTAEIYNYLKPLIVAVPSQDGININTASSTVMRSINGLNITTPLDESEVATLISSIPVGVASNGSTETSDESAQRAEVTESPYEQSKDFIQGDDAITVFGPNAAQAPKEEGLRTGSEYFLLTTEVELLNYKRKQISLLKRINTPTGTKTIVLRRSQAQL